MVVSGLLTIAINLFGFVKFFSLCLVAWRAYNLQHVLWAFVLLLAFHFTKVMFCLCPQPRKIRPFRNSSFISMRRLSNDLYISAFESLRWVLIGFEKRN